MLAARTPGSAQILSVLGSLGCLVMAIPSVILGGIAYSTGKSSHKKLGSSKFWSEFMKETYFQSCLIFFSFGLIKRGEYDFKVMLS